jgi:hypothetical protein
MQFVFAAYRVIRFAATVAGAAISIFFAYREARGIG